LFNLWNFVAYQCAWFAVILGAAHGMPQAGAAVAVLLAAVHLALRRERAELRLIGASIIAGLLVDSALVVSGKVQFAAPWPPGMAPFWMLSLWIAFATTLNHSLRWLMTRPLAAALAGALGGPLAYLAGARLGALTLVEPLVGLTLIAVLWALALGALAMVVLHAPGMPRARRQPA
jgi:uncharacterized protein DUF2878